MRRWTVLLAVLGIAVGAGIARADTYTWEFTLDGLQEVPPNASPATGFALVTLDTTLHQVSWDISYSGLIGTITAAHFHGPAPPGVNAGVQIGIPISASPLNGSAVTTAAQENYFLDGLMYVNIHSSVFPGGEIRGQVVPEPATLGLLAACGLLLRRR